MKLFLVHCGFYDPIAGDGIYEIHTNLFVLADSFDEAKAKAKALPEFKQRKMHIDGMQEIFQVEGHRLQFQKIKPAGTGTIIHTKRSSYARIPENSAKENSAKEKSNKESS